MTDTAVYLATLFQVDKHSSARNTPRQWQEDLMNFFSGHILVSKQSGVNIKENDQILLESSMMILKLNAELAAIKSENYWATELARPWNTGLDGNMRTRGLQRQTRVTRLFLQESRPNTDRRGFVSLI